MQQPSVPKNQAHAAIRAVALAGVLGACSGVLMAWIAPANKFSWAGLAVAPLWLLLEFFFDGVVGVLGTNAKAVRVGCIIAVLAGFYVPWFALRGFAP